MVSSKEQLLADLEANGAAAVAKLAALAPEQFERGRYENGWNGRQILAHMASIEWTYARLIELAAAPPAEGSAEGSERAASAQGGIDGYNARQVEKRANATVPELLEEFQANRRKTIGAVAAADEALFEVPIRSAGGRTGTLAKVFNEVALDHVTGHSNDIAG
jgi:uncharacterized damage-inducible protein DinB